jgi:RNA polymerase sigma factor (sigma-70 family)
LPPFPPYHKIEENARGISALRPKGTALPTDAALARLLVASTPAEQDAAWRDFVAAYSRLILHSARAVAREGDGAMDAYAFMLERLQADGFARLRAYREDSRAKFSTWLVVVLRRMAVDHRRQRVGREGAGEPSQTTQLRRRLDQLAGEVLDVAQTVRETGEAADEQVQRAEVNRAVSEALARLDSRDALLLTLRFEEDLPASRIAKVMGFPSQFHVYRRLKVVLGELREQLRRRGIDGPAP